MNYKFYLMMGITAINVVCVVHAIDNPHFYRATNMFPEPRIERNYLSSFDVTLGGGTTKKGRSAHNTIVPLFDIYGIQSIQELNANTPYNPNNPYDQLLTQLLALPSRPGFADISIGGSFNILESNISYIQNFAKGLLLFFHLPVRKLKISNVTFTDLSPDDTIVPNKNNPEWQAVYTSLNPILAYYGINTGSTTSTGVGDFTSMLGFTHNYQETKTIDFVDFTVMAGVLAPTGKKRNENRLFSLPTGYNGHWGFPLCTTISIGCYEWVTVGGYLNTLFFVNNNRTMRLKTDIAQSGIIKLAAGDVSIHKGPLINTGLYFKADHVAHGFSFTTAYSFASQQKDHLTPRNPQPFSSAIINSDSTLAGWNMHTINFMAEYDFAQEGNKIGNRIGIFYNLQVAGARTFNTNVAGGAYGLDISFCID